MNGNSTDANPKSSRELIRLVVYWSVALIPLAWGIVMTIKKAMALFY